jgi:hypothetical protein
MIINKDNNTPFSTSNILPISYNKEQLLVAVKNIMPVAIV